jgi:hypothetical protein
MTKWTEQVNDTIGGWIVTTYPHPDSEQFYEDKYHKLHAHGYIMAECSSEHDAKVIANLLNIAGIEREPAF